MNYNPELLKLAEWRLNQLEKSAFMPAGDPSGGAAPPGGGGPPPGAGDPAAMAGGAPPGAPVDPSMAGMDPSMMGGAPMPGGGGLTADSISQIVSQTVQKMQQQGGAGGGPGGGAGKAARPDLAVIAMDIYQTKKMVEFIIQSMGLPMPPNLIDGPNRDPATGAPVPPGAPNSTSAIGGGGAVPPPGPPVGGPPPDMPKQGSFHNEVSPIGKQIDKKAASNTEDTINALTAIYSRLKNENKSA